MVLSTKHVKNDILKLTSGLLLAIPPNYLVELSVIGDKNLARAGSQGTPLQFLPIRNRSKSTVILTRTDQMRERPGLNGFIVYTKAKLQNLRYRALSTKSTQPVVRGNEGALDEDDDNQAQGQPVRKGSPSPIVSDLEEAESRETIDDHETMALRTQRALGDLDL